MHDVFNNKAPRSISSLFTLASEYTIPRFSQASTFAIQNSRTQQRIRSFSCSGSKVWNCIPLGIRTLSKHKFKAAINRQLLDIVFLEDEDVDTLTTVKPVFSGHRIKRTPSIKRTVAEVPKFISLIYLNLNLY